MHMCWPIRDCVVPAASGSVYMFVNYLYVCCNAAVGLHRGVYSHLTAQSGVDHFGNYEKALLMMN